MPRMTPFLLLAATAMLGGCATTIPPIADRVGSATLRSADGTAKGTATLTSVDGKLELRIVTLNLPAGVHGVHLHAIGNCTAPDFASAGPHLNPLAKQHGMENPQGSHIGDLPNLTADGEGKGELRFILTGSQWELEPQLFDSDGTAVVVHAGPDDYRTDPSGNSGGRIACGILTRG